MTADQYISALKMQEHPEGGFFCETFRSHQELNFEGFEGKRSLATSIFFLLKAGQHSALHRIKSDEIWYHHDGDAVKIIELDEDGKEIVTVLGRDILGGEKLQHVVPAGRWFGARLEEEASFCLVGCQVSPGFDFRDFELL